MKLSYNPLLKILDFYDLKLLGQDKVGYRNMLTIIFFKRARIKKKQ